MSFLSTCLSSVFEFFFGCGHDSVTRPFTLKKHTYKVCLDCGKELPYSAVSMSYLTAREIREMQPARTATILAFDSPFTSLSIATRTPRGEQLLRDSEAVA